MPDGKAALQPAELPPGMLKAVEALVPELAALLEVCVHLPLVGSIAERVCCRVA